jgi:PAS domain S-box-containing protein
MMQEKTNRNVYQEHSRKSVPINGIYLVQDGKFVYVNQQLIRLSSYSKEELIGSPISQYIHPEDIPFVQENMQKRLSGKIKGVTYQYRAVRKDQSLIFFAALASKSMYKGRPAIIGSLIELTEQNQVEKSNQSKASDSVCRWTVSQDLDYLRVP